MQCITGIGIDICKIQRISSILSKTYSNRFLTKVLNHNELNASLTPEFVSGRWAAKEALVKAMGNRSILFPQVEIIYNASGQPGFQFYGETRDLLHKRLFFLSISHEHEFTIAVVLAMQC